MKTKTKTMPTMIWVNWLPGTLVRENAAVYPSESAAKKDHCNDADRTFGPYILVLPDATKIKKPIAKALAKAKSRATTKNPARR